MKTPTPSIATAKTPSPSPRRSLRLKSGVRAGGARASDAYFVRCDRSTT